MATGAAVSATRARTRRETPRERDLRLRDLRAYRVSQAQVRRDRGERCEVCATGARATHHLASVGSTGIASPLVSDPRNLLIVCNDCHALFHPGERAYDWTAAGAKRALAMGGRR